MPSTGRPTLDGIDCIDNVITQYDSPGLLHDEESGVISQQLLVGFQRLSFQSVTVQHWFAGNVKHFRPLRKTGPRKDVTIQTVVKDHKESKRR